jgi:hypothetical protein
MDIVLQTCLHIAETQHGKPVHNCGWETSDTDNGAGLGVKRFHCVTQRRKVTLRHHCSLLLSVADDTR